MQYRKSRALLAASVASIGVLGAWNVAPAAPVMWDGGGANDLFNTPLNWAADVTPAPLDSLTFAGTTRLTPSNNFAAGTTFGGITFDASAGVFTISGNALSLPQFGNVVNSSANLQTLSLPIALAPGDHTINGGTAGLALSGGLTRSGNNSVARFLGPVNATGLSNNAFGMIGTWATSGADYARVDGSGNVVPYTNFTELGTSPATPLANSPGVNIRWSQGVVGGDGAGTLNLNAGVTDLNTFSAPINNTQTVVFTPTSTLRFGAQGGVLKGANPSGLTLSFGPFATEGVGTITAGGADNTEGEIFFNSAFGTITVRPKIADNGTGKVRVITANGRTTGSSTSLSAHNSYSGGSYVVSGDLSASERDSFGTGSVEVAAGARAVLNPVNATTVADATYTNEFHIAGFGLPGSGGLQEGAMRVSRLADAAGTIHLLADSQITFRFANGTLGASISGKITGNAALTLGDSGANALFNINNSTNDWTGNTTLLIGTMRIGGTGNVIPNGAGKGNVNFASTSGTINLNGRNETINGLNGGASELDLVRIINNGASPSTLTVGDGDANGSYGGFIQNGSSSVAITKMGAGEQRIFGNNTYTGVTTVQGGRLVLAKDENRDAQAPVLTGGGADVQGGRLVFDYASQSEGDALSTTVSSDLTTGYHQTPKFNSNQIRTTMLTSTNRTLGWRNDVANTEVVVAYTYYGDTDLNGLVDFDDYSRIDAGFNNNRTGWENGDVDYNGIIDFDDYSLIDQAFNTQSGTLRRAMSYLDGGDRSDFGMNSPSLQLVMDHFGHFGQPYADGFLNAVPEPGSMLALGVLVYLTPRRRRRRRTEL